MIIKQEQITTGPSADQFNAEQTLWLVGIRQRAVSVVAHHDTELDEELPHRLDGIGVSVDAAVTVWHGLAGVPTLPFTGVHQYSVAKQSGSIAGDSNSCVAAESLDRTVDGPNTKALGVILGGVQVKERETGGRDTVPAELIHRLALRVILAVSSDCEIEQNCAVGSNQSRLRFETAIAIDWYVHLVKKALRNGAVIGVTVVVHEFLCSFKHCGVGDTIRAGLSKILLHGDYAITKSIRKRVV